MEEPGELQSMGSQKTQTWPATTQHNNNTSETSVRNWMIQGFYKKMSFWLSKSGVGPGIVYL